MHKWLQPKLSLDDSVVHYILNYVWCQRGRALSFNLQTGYAEYFLCPFIGTCSYKTEMPVWSNCFLKYSSHWFQRLIGRSSSDSLGIHRVNEVAVKLFSSLPWVFQILGTYPRTCVYIKFPQGIATVWNYSCTSRQLYILMYVCYGLSGTKINAFLLTSGPCQVTYSPFLATACACLTFCLGLIVD